MYLFQQLRPQRWILTNMMTKHVSRDCMIARHAWCKTVHSPTKCSISRLQAGWCIWNFHCAVHVATRCICTLSLRLASRRNMSHTRKTRHVSVNRGMVKFRNHMVNQLAKCVMKGMWNNCENINNAEEQTPTMTYRCISKWWVFVCVCWCTKITPHDSPNIPPIVSQLYWRVDSSWQSLRHIMFGCLTYFSFCCANSTNSGLVDPGSSSSPVRHPRPLNNCIVITVPNTGSSRCHTHPCYA